MRTEPAGIDTAEQARTLTVAALGTFLALVAFTLPLTTLTTQAAALDAGPEARASTDNVMLFCVLMAGRRPTRRTRTPPPRVIREIRQRRGSASAHHAKVVLSGVLGLAVRHDAIDANPVRELTPARKSKSTREKTALTEDGLCRLRQHLADSDDAAKYDLPDLVDVLSGLGCRIGELLALDWTRVDDVAGTIAIEGTVIRVPGGGAHRAVAHQVPGEHAHDHAARMGAGAACEEARRLARIMGVPVDRGHPSGPGQHT